MALFPLLCDQVSLWDMYGFVNLNHLIQVYLSCDLTIHFVFWGDVACVLMFDCAFLVLMFVWKAML